MKNMPQLLGGIGLAFGFAATAQAAPITGGTTQVTLTIASTLASLGASVSPLGTATVSDSSPPVATFPITGGSTSSTGDLIQHNGSGLEISASPTVVDTRNYLIDTANKVIDADVSENGTSAGTIGLFTLGSSGLTNVPLTLTSGAVTALNAAFGLSGTDALTTSTPIGTLTSSPTVGAVAAPEPATAAVVGVGLLALAAVRRRARAAL
ncbi:MAG: hypothetical protein JO157_05030 [Acetobacteraceae bacterium]|nr:hypothetical protein [Acetobacteraceae bacterium]